MGLYEEPDISKEELEQASEELRRRFLDDVKEKKGIQDDYCEADIDKIRNDDWYCQRFILHEKGDVDKALDMAKVSLKWRKEFGVHDIKESSLLVEFFEAGGVFPYNKDKLDNENLMILVKLNKKDSDIQLELRRFLIYWIERLDKQSNGKKMNVIFNCSSAGLGNLDLDMIRFIINAFKYYYPWLLESILVYDMPWLFGAAWKLIKSWLPQDDVKRVRFVNKKNILDLIDVDSLPISMGGTLSEERNNKELDEYKMKCKQQIQEALMDSSVEMEKTIEELNLSRLAYDSSTYVDINPNSPLTFPYTKEAKQQFILLNIRNITNHAVGYKVRSNNVDSYKVRPFNGIIKPGSSKQISVHLLKGFRILSKDKFLVQTIPVENHQVKTVPFNSLWINSSKSQRRETLFNCIYNKSDDTDVTEFLTHSEKVNGKQPEWEKKLNILNICARQLRFQNFLLKTLVIVLLSVQLVFAWSLYQVASTLRKDKQISQSLCNSSSIFLKFFCNPSATDSQDDILG